MIQLTAISYHDSSDNCDVFFWHIPQLWLLLLSYLTTVISSYVIPLNCDFFSCHTSQLISSLVIPNNCDSSLVIPHNCNFFSCHTSQLWFLLLSYLIIVISFPAIPNNCNFFSCHTSQLWLLLLSYLTIILLSQVQQWIILSLHAAIVNPFLIAHKNVNLFLITRHI